MFLKVVLNTLKTSIGLLTYVYGDVRKTIINSVWFKWDIMIEVFFSHGEPVEVKTIIQIY